MDLILFKNRLMSEMTKTCLYFFYIYYIYIYYFFYVNNRKKNVSTAFSLLKCL